MSKIVGIDLGTTNSLMGVMDAAFPVLIADVEGRRLTPSVVHFPGAGETPLVGAAAKRVRSLKASETVSSIKRFMGRRESGISREEMIVSYPVSGQGSEPVRVELHGRAWSPEENFGGGAQEVEGRCGALGRRNGHARGHYRAGLFQRGAAERKSSELFQTER